MSRSITHKFFISYLLLAVILAFSIGVPSYFFMRQLLEQSKKKELHLLALNSAELIHSRIDFKKDLLHKLVDSKEVEDYVNAYRLPALRQYLAKFKSSFTQLAFVNEHGIEEIKVVNGFLQQDFQNVSHQEIVKQAKANPNTVIVSGVDSAHDAAYIELAVQKQSYFGDQYAGMLVALVSLDVITRKLVNYRVGKTGYMFLTDAEGKIVYKKNDNHTAGQEIARRQPAIELLNKLKLTANGTAKVKWGQGTFIASYAVVPEVEWNLITVLPYRECVAAANTLRNMIFIVSVVVFFLTWVVASRLSTVITKSISRLIDATKPVSHGDFSQQINLDSGDEVEVLGEAFNQMTDNLKQLTVSKRYVDNIIDSMMGSLIVIAEDGRIASVNHVTCKLLGYQENELVGKPYDMVFDSKLKALFKRDEENNIFERGFIREIEAAYVKQDDTSLDILFSASLMGTGDDNNDEIVCVALDMTNIKNVMEEKKGLEIQLRQTQKLEAIGTLAGGIAHDFNNILASVIGYTELALAEIKKQAGNEVVEEDLRSIMSASQRARALIKQILTFAHRSNEEVIPVQMSLLTKECFKLLRATLPATIELKQNITSKSYVLADPAEIHQVVMNLCTNAAQAMSEQTGAIRIDLVDVRFDVEHCPPELEGKPGEYMKLTVADSGCGIDEEILSKIFDPFFTTKKVGEGTGLGLSVVHGIIQKCQGAITVESQPAKGTTFHVYLPIIEMTEEFKEEDHSEIPTGNERILFVDDEPSLTYLGQQNLKSLGYNVVVYNSSLRALKHFMEAGNDYDLVITDMAMPNLSGDKLAMKILRIRPDIPIIICTGHSAGLTTEKVKKMGIKALINKPATKKELAKTIRNVLTEK